MLRIPFFIPAVMSIAKTDLVLTVPRTLAIMMKRTAPLRMVEAPRELNLSVFHDLAFSPNE